VTGQLPFGKTAADVQDNEPASEIRDQLRCQLPWLSHPMEANPSGGLISVILSCWRRQPHLRPPAAFVSQQLLDILTQEYVPPVPAALLPDSTDNGKIDNISNVCWNLIQKARKSHGIESIRVALPADDFALLLQKNQQTYDPVISFLLGAAIWWKISEFNEWNDDLSEATDMHPDCSPLLFHRLLGLSNPSSESFEISHGSCGQRT
jgi:hypothetical protein